MEKNLAIVLSYRSTSYKNVLNSLVTDYAYLEGQ